MRVKEINIAKVLVQKRKEKAVTQDELAAYIGVSKASVSKWETGQSYPDITFLPQLAAYFNISIDELIGYKPQMTKEDINKLYHKLAHDFSIKPFDDVLSECHKIIKKYYSCFPLLLQMAVLFINHYMLAEKKDEQDAVLKEAADLCRRIKAEENDIYILNEANSIEALCCLTMQQPKRVLELLDSSMKPSSSNETILASAYEMTGNMSKAKEILQIGIYEHLLKMTDMMVSYLVFYQNSPKQFENILQHVRSIAEAFHLDVLSSNIMLTIYLVAAQGYALQKNSERALDMIKKYADICTSDSCSFILHGDEFFDSIDSWFEEFDLGSKAPRDEKVIKEGILQAITENPAFALLKDEPRFKGVIEEIKSKLANNKN